MGSKAVASVFAGLRFNILVPVKPLIIKRKGGTGWNFVGWEWRAGLLQVRFRLYLPDSNSQVR